MSDSTKHNQNLKDLLSKKPEQNKGDFDEFEQAAMEGFASLENETEALNLKKSLDAKIYTEVFKREKQESRRFYWLTAATIVGVIGFSIYFFQSNFFEKKIYLAIETTPIPSSKQTFKKSEAPIKQDIAPQANPRPEIKTIILNKPNASAPSSQINLDNEGEASKQSEEIQESLISADASTPATAMNVNAGGVLQKEEKALTQPAEDLAGSPMAAPVKTESRDSNLKKRNQDEGARESSVQESTNLSEISTVSSKALPTITYKGGDSELKKQLREKLEAKKMLYKFDAMLYVAKKGKVEKVILSNTNDLKVEDQQVIVELLKSFKDFSVKGLKADSFIVYRIEFRP